MWHLTLAGRRSYSARIVNKGIAQAGRSAWALPLLWFLTPLLLVASSPVHGEEPVLTGTVRNLSPRPLAGVIVSAYQTPTNVVATAVTDADGGFQLTNLVAGAYRVLALMPAQGALALWYPGAYSYDEATPVTVSAGENPPLSFALADSGRVGGVVTDWQGAPLPGVLVNLYAPGFRFLAGGRTDDQGRYLVEGIPPGEYTVLFADPAKVHHFRWHGDTTDFRQAARVTVADAGVTPPVGIRLYPESFFPTRILTASYRAADATLALEWFSEPGVTYAIEAADALDEPTAFTTVRTGIQATGETTRVELALDGRPRRFYRIEIR
jgi:hypothetical protein